MVLSLFPPTIDLRESVGFAISCQHSIQTVNTCKTKSVLSSLDTARDTGATYVYGNQLIANPFLDLYMGLWVYCTTAAVHGVWDMEYIQSEYTLYNSSLALLVPVDRGPIKRAISVSQSFRG